MPMLAGLDDAEWPVQAGADIIVTQGSEGGGHVGMMSTRVLVLQVVAGVAPTPILAAGGIADGCGLAAALALWASGNLPGTPFLATPTPPPSALHANHSRQRRP
jgi:NAD(P)H-dependent flavin oxidoreductase YrpB (nitropropane dioxygenase family)